MIRATMVSVSLALATPIGMAGPSLPPTHYRPPVVAPILDGFRPSSTPYGPGNRGVDYLTQPGDPVRAIGPGTVTFAGSVARQRWITVSHPDGLRSSYSVAVSLVVFGQRVVVGEQIGLAGGTVHLGVRRGDAYINPLPLFRTRHAVLVRTGAASHVRVASR